MEDIIAYSIIAIIALAVIFGAVLLRRRFVRSTEQNLKLRQEQNEWFAKKNEDRKRQFKDQNELLAQAHSEEAVQLRDRAERLRIKGFQNVTPTYRNLGNAGAQRYDPKTGTIQTAVYDNTSNDSQWRTLGGGGGNTSVQPALGGSGGTTSAQPVPVQASNRTSDLFTGMALGSLVNSLFSSPSYSRPSSDDSDSRKSSFSSWSDSSSSDSSSSDSGPSSDW